jgi:hypothetical protein
MIKHILTILVVITFTSCLLSENEEQKESNYQDNRSSSSVYSSSESKETYSDNISSSSVYYSSKEENQIEKQNQNGIKAGVYKSTGITFSITYNYSSGMVLSGSVYSTNTLNLKPDNTYSYELTMRYLIEGNNIDLTDNTSGTWSFLNEELCTDIKCYPVRNITSFSYEYYVDMTKPVLTEGVSPATVYMDFAGWITMNRQ